MFSPNGYCDEEKNGSRHFISDFSDFSFANPQRGVSGGCAHFHISASHPPDINQERFKACLLIKEVSVFTPVPSCDSHDRTLRAAFKSHELSATFVTVSSRQYHSAFDSYLSILTVFG